VLIVRSIPVLLLLRTFLPVMLLLCRLPWPVPASLLLSAELGHVRPPGPIGTLAHLGRHTQLNLEDMTGFGNAQAMHRQCHRLWIHSMRRFWVIRLSRGDLLRRL